MKQLIQSLKKKEQKCYSLNFLLSEFDEIEDFNRDTKILNTRIKCCELETNDFKSRVYYKQLSSVLKVNSNDKDQSK